MRCAVLGRPIAHSLSPALHRAAYRALGLDWDYDAVDVGEQELAGFLAGLDSSWRGLSLTMPLKRVVMPLLDETSATATLAGAANTVLFEPDGRRLGHNTDVPGMVNALREQSADEVTEAVILGGGATATSAVLALSRLGCGRFTLYVREPARAAETAAVARRLDPPPELATRRLEELAETTTGHTADVTVSTIPASAQSAYAAGVAEMSATVFDVTYDPWPTPLARAAQATGRTLIGGLDLLVHQATRQVELMTGCAPAPVAAMRRAALEATGARHS